MNRKNEKSMEGTEWVREEMQNALHRGIRVSIGGKYYVKEDENLSVIAENGCYMADYISDENGKIVQINFEQIE